MLKSIGVVVGSYLLSVVLVLATDPVLSRILPGEFVRGREPSTRALIISTLCFALVSAFCAWVCARYAPNRAGRHVLWLIAIGETMGLTVTIANWKGGFPHWYLLSWMVAWPVACWVGLKLSGRGNLPRRHFVKETG